jgi:hypothetical protein
MEQTDATPMRVNARRRTVAVNNFRVMSLPGIPSDSVGGGWTFCGNVRKARIQTQTRLLRHSHRPNPLLQATKASPTRDVAGGRC